MCPLGVYQSMGAVFCPYLPSYSYRVPALGLPVQELCVSRGGRSGLSVLTSLLVSVDVRLY